MRQVGIDFGQLKQLLRTFYFCCSESSSLWLTVESHLSQNVLHRDPLLYHTYPRTCYIVTHCTVTRSKVTLHCSVHRLIPSVHLVSTCICLKISNAVYFTDKNIQIFNNTIYVRIISYCQTDARIWHYWKTRKFSAVFEEWSHKSATLPNQNFLQPVSLEILNLTYLAFLKCQFATIPMQ